MEREAADYLRSLCGQKQPEVGIVCGSGWKSVGNLVQSPLIIPLHSVPGMPHQGPTVLGHGQSLLIGSINNVVIMVVLGRLHWYEGHDMDTVCHLVRVMAAMGIKKLVLTNAAGALNPEYRAGDLMIIEDHISLPNLVGISPLRGHPNSFLSLTNLYWPRAPEVCRCSASQLKIHKGVYVHLGGPCFETKAEVRMLRGLGGDAVGMSTVPEVIAAKHAGIEIIMAISLITNEAVAEHGMVGPSHGEVLQEAAKHEQTLSELIQNIIGQI